MVLEEPAATITGTGFENKEKLLPNLPGSPSRSVIMPEKP